MTSKLSIIGQSYRSSSWNCYTSQNSLMSTSSSWCRESMREPLTGGSLWKMSGSTTSGVRFSPSRWCEWPYTIYQIYQVCTDCFTSYLQCSAEDPLALPRKKALERIKRIASAQLFEAEVKWENFVKMPAKPTRARRSMAAKISSIESDDEMFEVLVS